MEDPSIQLNDGDTLEFRASWDGRPNKWGQFHCVIIPHPKILNSNSKDHHTIQSPHDVVPMVIAEHKESKELDLEKAIEDLQIPEIQNAKKKSSMSNLSILLLFFTYNYIFNTTSK